MTNEISSISTATPEPEMARISVEASDALVDRHLDAVLRASGSALKRYTVQKTRDNMRAAMRLFAIEISSTGKQGSV